MRVGYSGTIREFLDNPDRVVAELSLSGRTYCVVREQAITWGEEVNLLRDVVNGLEDNGRIYFEYDIPRMAKRADVVLLADGILFVLEFKIRQTPGETREGFNAADVDQVDDYAHDFAYFHSKSHRCPIVPILIDTDATDPDDAISVADYAVYNVLRCSTREKLRSIIQNAIAIIPRESRVVDYDEWERGVYEPTPTIVQAAEALYANHTVAEITRSGAGAEGIRNATAAINQIVHDAQINRKKVICFLTGVPGAGKTLVGMNLVASRDAGGANRVFLSGNYPLVKVLQEALIRNRLETIEMVKRRMLAGEELDPCQQAIANDAGLVRVEHRGRGTTVRINVRGRVSRKQVEREVVTKIQLVAHFRSGYDEGADAPNEHVFVFDESQRAWSANKLQSDEKRCDGMSEPDILLSYLDRHPDWCVAVALVGGGQDIHDGEAGIEEWYKALANKFVGWEVYVARDDATPEYQRMQQMHGTRIHINEALYLDHPMRSFRAQRVSDFVEALLLGRTGLDAAREALDQLRDNGEDGRIRFPIFVTRNLDDAKQKVKMLAHGRERYGMLMSARAKRLRHYGMHTLGQDFDQIAWFLDDKGSINSSYSMEIAASEFKVQGLEIDYALVGWDGDFMYDSQSGQFVCQDFKVSEGRWKRIEGANAEIKCRYLTNAYRVILTRARQGMVIYVPTGDVSGRDQTVPTAVYNSTYDFLKSVGIDEL